MQEQQIKVFKKVLKFLIKEIEELKNIDVDKFKDNIIDAFDGYNYEGEDEVIGLDNWIDITKDGEYELNAKVNHEDAYELTIFITTKDKKVSVRNVL